MLKLGDKTIMGVVLPTVIFLVIFIVPWLDRNPYRLASRRKFAVAIGILFSVIMVILTYMGTPGFGIETPPAQDILSHLSPATEPGPVRELPWDELETGPDGVRKTYFVSYPPAWEDDPAYADRDRYEFVSGLEGAEGNEFHHLLREFKAEVENHPKLIAPIDNQAPLAQVTVEQIQPGLKWVVLTITWDEMATDPETGETTLKRHVKAKPEPDVQTSVLAIHQDAAYGE
jgi:hypothetical protein